MWVGFILSAFPNAKIINLDRDPRATCWSIYKHNFSNDGNGYSYSMSNLAKFYKLYKNLMSFWHEIYPDSIYDLNYENLTENQETETRKLLNFCDLEWEEQCLQPENNKRMITTLSSHQVRESITKKSIKYSDNFKKYIPKIISALN